jgi:hypothetical protein
MPLFLEKQSQHQIKNWPQTVPIKWHSYLAKRISFYLRLDGRSMLPKKKKKKRPHFMASSVVCLTVKYSPPSWTVFMSTTCQRQTAASNWLTTGLYSLCVLNCKLTCAVFSHMSFPLSISILQKLALLVPALYKFGGGFHAWYPRQENFCNGTLCVCG